MLIVLPALAWVPYEWPMITSDAKRADADTPQANRTGLDGVWTPAPLLASVYVQSVGGPIAKRTKSKGPPPTYPQHTNEGIMAYQPRDLSVLAYANGFTLWHYTTPDAHTTVRGAGYFNQASRVLRLGDMIMTNTSVEDVPLSGMLVVTACNGGNVTVAPMTVFPDAE